MSEKFGDSSETQLKQRIFTTDTALPIEGSVELTMPVEQLWNLFCDVPAWPHWNPCFWRSRVLGGTLKIEALLYWWFNPIRPQYLYKMPAIARIVECQPQRLVTWEVTIPPGFHALHSYCFESLGENLCRFGSWEVAEGPVYQIGRSFWLAHFRYVCQSSLEGIQQLVQEDGR